jgi:hypothetical protein
VGPESRLPQLSDAEPEAGKKPHFGDANCVVLSGETNLSIRSVSYSDVPSSVSSWALGPGVDWFVTDRFSLGLGFSFSHSQVVGLEGPRLVEQKNSGFGAQFRIGFDVSITDWLSWYPRISLAADTGSFSVTDGTNTNAASTIEGTTVGASLPLLVQVADHFFVGFGPSATHDLSRAYGRRGQQNRNTTIGANTLVGGWL